MQNQEPRRDDAERQRLQQALEVIDALRIVCTCPTCERTITLPAYIRTGDIARAVTHTTCICGEQLSFSDKAKE